MHRRSAAPGLQPRCAILQLSRAARAAVCVSFALLCLLPATGCGRRDPAAEHAALVARGHDVFFSRCAPCHGPQGDWPMVKRLKGRSAGEFYALFDHLPSVNPIMPPFDDAPDADRRAVAAYLASLKADSWDHGSGGAPPRPRADRGAR